MIINHNLGANNANRNMSINAANAGKSMEKLSSGLRINKAGDDAAGLAISEKMRGQIRGLDQASSNAQDGISLVQTAEGALNETTSILQRMRELSVQSSNDTATDDDRKAMQTENGQLKSEIDRIASTTQFNTKTLLNGSIAGASTAQATKTDSLQLTAFARLTAAGATSATNIDIQTKTFAINGVNVITGGSIGGASAATNGAAVAAAINGASGIGVTASADGSGVITLVNKTAGQNVTVTGGAADLQKLFGANGTDTSIAQSAAVTGSTLLIDLANNNGVSLGLQATDSVTSAATTGGTANSSHAYTVLATSTLTNLFSDITTNLTSVSAAAISNNSVELTGVNANGTNGALSNIKLSSTNRSTFNSQFSNFLETQAAKDTHADSSLSFQIGANQGQTMAVGIDEMSSKSLSLSGVDISTLQGAQTATTAIDNAIKAVSAERSNLGAFSNRLEHTINNLGTSSENLTSAESRIRDVDMAKEMSTFSKNNILSQAAQAMLAQANQQPQQVLQLLR